MTDPPPYAEIEAALKKANRELDEAMLRLGSLGLNPVMPGDLAGLCARLGAMGTHGHKGYPTHDINPDGAEAAAAIEHLNTQVQEARAAALEEEREACARLAELRVSGGIAKTAHDHEAFAIAAAIRNRALIGTPAGKGA